MRLFGWSVVLRRRLTAKAHKWGAKAQRNTSFSLDCSLMFWHLYVLRNDNWELIMNLTALKSYHLSIILYPFLKSLDCSLMFWHLYVSRNDNWELIMNLTALKSYHLSIIHYPFLKSLDCSLMFLLLYVLRSDNWDLIMNLQSLKSYHLLIIHYQLPSAIYLTPMQSHTPAPLWIFQT